MASANGLTLDLDDLPALIAALRRVALPDMRPPPKTDGGAISNPRDDGCELPPANSVSDRAAQPSFATQREWSS